MSPEFRSFRSMGVEVLVSGADEDELEAVRNLFEDWDRIFSTSRPESELSRVNGDPSPVVVLSRPFAHALRTGLAAAAATDGLVDPTLGGSWHELRLAGRLLARPTGTRLDVNCVANALAVDAALDLIRGPGLVSAGGDVAVRGEAVVGLSGGGSLVVEDGGVATSGITGRPAQSIWDEVTVAAGSCAAAHVAAEAAFLLSDDGPEWLDERDLPGRFVVRGRVTANRSWASTMAAAA